MSTGKRSLASLKDFTQAPNSRAALETLLYGDDVDYKGLRYVFLLWCACVAWPGAGAGGKGDIHRGGHVHSALLQFGIR